MSLKYFIYARKSSESEDRQMASIDDQISEMKQQAKELDFSIVDVISEAKSAKEPGRPLFNDMLLRIHKGEAQGILCWKLNRLARNPVDGGQISWLLQQNIIQHIQTHGRDYKPSDNVLMMQVEFGMANQFVKDLSVDVRRGMRKKAERGWYPAPLPPLGYIHNTSGQKSAGAEIVIDKKVHPLVKKLWKLMLTGMYSTAGIEREAKRLGLRNRKGNPYGKSTFFGMLTNEFYCGYFYWKDEHGERVRHKGKHKALVSRADFEKVQKILKENGHLCPKRGELKFTYAGLISCGECQRAVTAERVYQGICPNCKYKFSIKNRSDCPKCGTDLNKHSNVSKVDRTYYQCTKYKRACSQRSIQPDDLESQTISILESVSIDEEIFNWLVQSLKDFQKEEQRDEDQIMAGSRKKISELNTRLASLVQMRADGEITSDEMAKVKESTKQELYNLETELAVKQQAMLGWRKIVEERLKFTLYATKKFKEGDDLERKTILRNLFPNLELRDKKLYPVTDLMINCVKECVTAYGAQKGTSEPEKTVATYGELCLSEPFRSVLCAKLNALRTYQIGINSN